MSNKSTIKCPNCSHEFDASDVFRDEVERELKMKVKEWQVRKEEAFKKRENELKKEFEETLTKQKLNMEETLRKSIGDDYEVRLKLLLEENAKKDEKLKEVRQLELEYLKKSKELEDKANEIDILVQRKINEESAKITEAAKKQEQEKSELKIKELEKQLADAKKLAEEVQRKAEQGSMQLQGEVQELALEELLRNSFPFDLIEEVGKGVKGADCVLTVRNKLGQPCGKIIFESKRTKAFSGEWIEKLKSDMRSQQADVAILVTETMPRDMDFFGEKEGVWICRFSEVKAITAILRNSLIKIAGALQNQENRGEKMAMLYNYLTSNEFSEQWSAIREGFMSMKLSIQRERDAMEKLWKAREKQLEKVLLNASHIKGSIEGIAGMESLNLNIEEGENRLLE